MTIVQLNFIKENSNKLTRKELMKKVHLSYHQIRLAQKANGIVFKPEREKTDYIPAAKQLRVLEIITLLCAGPKSISAIRDSVLVHDRTAYRYIQLLKSLGIEIDRDKEGRYSLKNCPFCKRLI